MRPGVEQNAVARILFTQYISCFFSFFQTSCAFA